jgi:DNA invertase Pin-like site-specific DNA recombinase
MRHSSTINGKQGEGPNPHSLNCPSAEPKLGLRQSDFALDLNPIFSPSLRKSNKVTRLGSDGAGATGLTFPRALYRRHWYSEVQKSVERNKRAALYLRVSSNGQDTGPQETALREYVRRRNWTVHGIYKDLAVSGTRSSRPALDQLLKDCRRGKFDVLLVWKFDRFARSLKTLISGLELCRAFGIDFVSVTEAVDTSLSTGQMLFQLLAVFSEFERSLITERVRAGLEHARKNGQILGRPPLRKLTRKEVAQLRADRAQRKVPFRTLAEKFGVSVWTAHQLCSSRKTPPRCVATSTRKQIK